MAGSKQPPGLVKQPPALSRQSPGLPHDTPVDTPAVTGIERSAPPPLARRAETLEAAYTAWAELEAERSALVKTFAAEAEQLEQQGSLFLGAVNAVGPSQASSDQPAALVRQSNLEQLATEARKRLEASKVDLDQRVQREQQRLTEAIAVTVAEVRARVARRLAHARPSIELMVRVLQGDRRILHVRRLTPDDAVTLVFASSGRIPSRYGFLFDDSTDDATLPPPTLYGEPGIAPRGVAHQGDDPSLGAGGGWLAHDLSVARAWRRDGSRSRRRRDLPEPADP